MRNEYPRPDFVRDSFISLNEEWDFEIDNENIGHREKWFLGHNYSKKINVPFCVESELSGIQDTGYHDHVWYKKNLGKINLKSQEVLILHFEGVDYLAEVYINGILVTKHIGSNAAFQADLTDYINADEDNILTVYCFDPGKDRSIPRGKQDWEETGHAIWYTRTTGIYKSVWMQVVNKAHIRNFYFKTKLQDYLVDIDLEITINKGRFEFEISRFDNLSEKYAFDINKEKDNYALHLPYDFANEHIWSVERPHLFNITMRLYDENGILVDTVKSYLGIREVKAENGYVLLNNRPIYQKLVLNQGYYPRGILTPESIEAMEKDIDAMIEMGFNGCRIHQKTEDPYFLYLCDRKGFLIWQECAENYGFNSYNQRRMLNEWIEIVKNNYNHPCIIAYTPLNESWGVEGIPYNKQIQDYAMSLYYMIHSLDDTRFVISNDGWEQCKTDLLTVHNYGHGQTGDKVTYEKFIKLLSTREEIVKFENINRYIINPGFCDEGQPVILSEFGGVAFNSDTEKDKKAWGYTTCVDGEEYASELKRIYQAISVSKCIQGICYTQLTDVEQEVNGLMTFDRKYKIDPKIIKELNDSLTLK